jgi:hypothetical protein
MKNGKSFNKEGRDERNIIDSAVLSLVVIRFMTKQLQDIYVQL